MKIQLAQKKEFSINDKKTIKQRIDFVYQSKLKEVSQAILKKLESYGAEHKHFLKNSF